MQITQRLRSMVQKGVFPSRGIPLALLAVCILSFGLLIPWLGFYHDEWHFVYYDAIRGTRGMMELFTYDGHPLSAFIYIFSFKLVGFTPLAWHIYSLVWRWLAVTMFWLVLDKMWPNHKRFSLSVALLFAIYPLFVLQILPISYFEVWVSFFLFFLSLYATIQAIRHPDKFWLFTGLAIAAKIGQMFTSEYTWGMEMMRPLFIWFALSENLSKREKIKQTLRIFLPYLIIFLSFAFWRSFVFQAGRKEIAVSAGWLTHPFSTVLSWLRFGLPDMGLILITSWFQVLEPDNLDLNKRLNVLIIALIILSSVGIMLMLNRLPKAEREEQDDKNPGWPAILIGISGLIFGILPSYAIGYIIYLSAPPGNTRFALGALPGAALLIMGLIQLLIDSQKARNLLTAVLVGISIGWHVRYTSEFSNLWQNQVNFYRQLVWRAPGLHPGTALIAVDNIFPKTRHPATILAVSGDYPTAMALNTIYATGPQTKQVPYWFFSDSTDLINNPAPGGMLNGSHLDSNFTGRSEDALIVMYTPNSSECLRLIRPSDADYRGYPDTLRSIAKSASLDAINTEASPNSNLLNTILGPENQDTWCSYYQKADLAAQKENWQQVSALWEQASKKKLTPSNGFELLPFTEALLHNKQWNPALKLTIDANKLTHNAADIYCPLWNRLGYEQPASQELEQALLKVGDVLGCR